MLPTNICEYSRVHLQVRKFVCKYLQIFACSALASLDTWVHYSLFTKSCIYSSMTLESNFTCHVTHSHSFINLQLSATVYVFSSLIAAKQLGVAIPLECWFSTAFFVFMNEISTVGAWLVMCKHCKGKDEVCHLQWMNGYDIKDKHLNILICCNPLRWWMDDYSFICPIVNDEDVAH